jgi:hypothetical protein
MFLWIVENIIKNNNEDLDFFLHHTIINKLFEYVQPTEVLAVRSSGLAVFRILF